MDIAINQWKITDLFSRIFYIPIIIALGTLSFELRNNDDSVADLFPIDRFTTCCGVILFGVRPEKEGYRLAALWTEFNNFIVLKFRYLCVPIDF